MINRGIVVMGVVVTFAACKTSSRDQWEIPLQEKQQFHIDRAGKNAPNVIIIMADDLGKHDISAYGSTEISTPNIDKIGQNGVKFDDAYVTSPICAPSRAAIMTGKYQQRYGFETQPMEFYPNRLKYVLAKNAKRLGDWNVVTKPPYPRKEMLLRQGIPLNEITLPELFQVAGYSTALIGKWHLGYGDDFQPQQRGFDYHYGFLGAFSRYTPEKKTTGFHTHVQDEFSSKYQWKVGRNDNAKIVENGREVVENDYLTFAFTNKAKKYISEHKDEPFFLHLSYNAPHVPFQAPDKYYNQFSHVSDENKRIYLAMIKALDDAVGDLMAHLEELKLLENTVIYFLSDNGGASYTNATDNGPLNGGKITMFEGGINVPFLMQWKDMIQPGTIYKNPVSALDIFPTSIAAAQLNISNQLDLDGINLFPYIQNKTSEKPHETLFWRANHIRAIRHNNWKMILSVRDNWLLLYNLDTDKSEEIDLSEMKPEEKEELIQYFEKWNNQLPEKPLWPRIMDKKFIINGKEYLFPA